MICHNKVNQKIFSIYLALPQVCTLFTVGAIFSISSSVLESNQALKNINKTGPTLSVNRLRNFSLCLSMH